MLSGRLTSVLHKTPCAPCAHKRLRTVNAHGLTHVRSEARYLGQMCIDLTAEHGAFDPTEHVTVTAGNVISAILFGRRFEHDDKEFQSILTVSEEFAKAASTENLADFIPILQYVPNVRLRKYKELVNMFNLFLERNVEEHYKQDGLLKNNLANVTDSLIAMSKETKLNENVNRRISKEQVTSTVIDLFGAGRHPLPCSL
uniref:Uncharacterized protein n=1 Tax=Eptatretus burgeri TaxID=7764 RepID=A0A8C4Q7B0_EPTBU